MNKWRRNARKGRARRVIWTKAEFCNHMYEQIYNTIVDNMPKSFEISDTTVACIMRVVDSLNKSN